MKLKKYIFTVFLSVFLSTLVSCDWLFNDAPINTISEKEVWHNPMLLDEYVNAWYRSMGNGFSTYVPSLALVKNASRYNMAWFTDQLSVGKNNWFNAGYGDLLKGNEQELTKWAKYNWNIYFTQIQAINLMFENQGSIPESEQKRRVLGEGHFFRAYYYYILWRLHGGVMLIDHTYNPLENAEKFPRASYQQMVNFIVKEADAAAQLLPVTYASTDVGRATKGAALMLKAKTYLWASAEVFQNKQADQAYLGFTDDQSTQMLTLAKAAYEAVINLNTYRLLPISEATQDGIKNGYRKIFLTKNSQESIFEIQHANDGDYATKFGHKLDRDAASPFFTGTTAAYTPTQNHVDEYGMRGGAAYDALHPYENRDYRFYANILYDGCTFKGHVMDIHYDNNTPGADLKPYGTAESPSVSRTGYYMGKFVDEAQTIDRDGTKASKQNYIIWRYAEVLLDYAEVLYRLGDVSGALTQVNIIRNRVHMDPLTALSWDALVNERRVELAFEETTYWDLLRWGIAQQRLNGSSNPLKAMRIDLKSGVYKYTISNLNRFPGRIRRFAVKQYYLPIPWSEVKYQGIQQNPEWTEV